MNLNETKISGAHLSRRAWVYVRLATTTQIGEQAEYLRRQYALKGRAEDLGWAPEAVEVVDSDLGQSGGGGRRRPGFDRLLKELRRGRVGVVLVLDVSRLTRSAVECYRFVELCSRQDVLIADERSVWSPKDPSDRLHLGLLGSMAEVCACRRSHRAPRGAGGKVPDGRQGGGARGVRS